VIDRAKESTIEMAGGMRIVEDRDVFGRVWDVWAADGTCIGAGFSSSEEAQQWARRTQRAALDRIAEE
jgi:hypothetical protein